MIKSSAAILLHPSDNVWIVCRDIAKGEVITMNGVEVSAGSDVPVGHKIAFKQLAAGVKVTRYGAPIGSLMDDVEKGDHIHTHNLKSDYLPSHGRGAVGPDGGGKYD